MDTPQDPIKQLIPLPSTATVARGPGDLARKTDGGAGFADAMRAAKLPNDSAADAAGAAGPEQTDDTTPVGPKPTQAATRAEARAVSGDEAADGPESADMAREAAAAARTETQTDRNAVAPTGSGVDAQSVAAMVATGTASAPLAAGGAVTRADTAPSITRPITPSAVDGVAPHMQTMSANGMPGPAPAAASTAGAAFDAVLSQATSRPVDAVPVGPDAASAADATGAAAPTSQAVASPAAGAALGTLLAASAGGVVPVASRPQVPALADGIAAAAPDLTAATATGAAAGTVPAPTTAAAPFAVAMAPSAVALAVDRATGNAMTTPVSLTGFKPANDTTGDGSAAATIAGNGFVAAALQTGPMLGDAAAVTAADTAPGPATPTTRWLDARPDTLSLTLADGAIAADPAAQVPVELEGMLQSLDARISRLTAASANSDIVMTASGEDPLAAISGSPGATPAVVAGIAMNGAGTRTDAAEPVRLSINAPMEQSTRWAAEVGDRLAWVANSRLSAATLQINPPQLGPIEVRIVMSGDQAAVSFAAVQPQTREAIQQALPALASSFASQGLTLGQTSVGRDGMPQPGGQGSSDSGGGRFAAGVVRGDREVEGISGVVSAGRGGQGLVDTFA